VSKVNGLSKSPGISCDCLQAQVIVLVQLGPIDASVFDQLNQCEHIQNMSERYDMPMGQHVSYEWDLRLWLHIFRAKVKSAKEAWKACQQAVPPEVVWLSSLLFLFISEVRTLVAPADSAESTGFADDQSSVCSCMSCVSKWLRGALGNPACPCRVSKLSCLALQHGPKPLPMTVAQPFPTSGQAAHEGCETAWIKMD
jgi:hypothetical protein